ncbi:MAG: hypothetical protein Unbinned4139contig1000_29 [Prokaryotic dsDNA virus sp.]|nr:MAG: hypothetical protein Unbinned4139contig1000_29 [Prokaryotic dsDNA virus sp.]|tara:strand:+ start:87 stop:530 length:444 start_codon:yes stop_codon:yes gene_type:complete
MTVNVDKLKADRAREVRIMRDKAAVRIAGWALPTIILLFGGLVFSIIYIEDAAMIAIIASSTSSISMALIAILNSMTGAQKEDPITSLMKEQSQVTKELIEHLKNEKSKSQSIRLGEKEVSLTEGSLNIHVSDDDKVWGKNKLDKDE